MKLFDDMTFDEKLSHIESCRINGLEEINKGSPAQLADIADHLDYWEPWLLETIKVKQKVIEVLKKGIRENKNKCDEYAGKCFCDPLNNALASASELEKK
jgi:hypothetical protein